MTLLQLYRTPSTEPLRCRLPSAGAGMRRANFLGVLVGATGAWPLAARAQQSIGHIARIAYLGFLSSSTLDPRQIDAFKEGLRGNGLIEGRNIAVDYVWAEGRQDRLRELAEDLAKRNLDVIVTAGPQPMRALTAARTATPIVFAILGDPVSSGFIASLARPGGE
jgi:putative ABC transport system substrate-binding protein